MHSIVSQTYARYRPAKALIGMVHVGALPGTPMNETSVELIAGAAADEARVLAEAGFDALIVENMHDAPYVTGPAIGPEITAAMARVVLEVEAAVELPVGVQILACGNQQAVAVAAATGAGFVRAENFVFSHIADEGLLAEAEAGPLLRYRRAIGADGVAVFADIKKKHASHALTADVSLEETAEAAAYFGADGLIVTGPATAKPVDLDELARVRGVTDLPLLVGSGVTAESAPRLLEHADALIVGSAIKAGGRWSNPVDPARAREVAAALGR